MPARLAGFAGPRRPAVGAVSAVSSAFRTAREIDPFTISCVAVTSEPWRLPSARSPREGRVVGGVAESAVSTPTTEIDDGEHSFAFDAKGQKSRENAS